MANVAVRDAIEKAIRIAGSERKLAKLAGFSQNAIWHAKKEGRVTGRLALAIEAATGGKIARHRLCPTLFEPPTAKAHAPPKPEPS
jgi:DNA-binding transcriptional regulator YdaS (Cro superfamily)